jgi:hypothetical protein
MGREIKLDDDALRIRYSGLTRWIVLLREVEVHYGEIESVEVGLGQTPRFNFRVGSYVSKRVMRGRFKADGRWWFLDVRGDRQRVVVIRTIPGSHFAVVGFEPADGEDPDALAESLRARL